MKKPNYTVVQWLRLSETMPHKFMRTLRTGVIVAFMFNAVPANATPVGDYISQVQTEQTVITLSVNPAASHFDTLDRLATLQDNWDGDGAVSPNPNALKNCRKLVSLLDEDQLKALPQSNVYASSYGSVVLDFETHRGLVSVEVGDDTMGFYTDFIDGDNYAVEGISTSFEQVPNVLQQYLS